MPAAGHRVEPGLFPLVGRRCLLGL